MPSRTVNVRGRVEVHRRKAGDAVAFVEGTRDVGAVCDAALDALLLPFAGQEVLVSATFRVLPVVAIADGRA